MDVWRYRHDTLIKIESSKLYHGIKARSACHDQWRFTWVGRAASASHVALRQFVTCILTIGR
jgi:hypothetical protein